MSTRQTLWIDVTASANDWLLERSQGLVKYLLVDEKNGLISSYCAVVTHVFDNLACICFLLLRHSRDHCSNQEGVEGIGSSASLLFMIYYYFCQYA